ncbi:MAG: hypothetical protein HETSPECPRED_004660 [Heterodermia speciosa]|uniref:Myb-like domain-containing protein n=1 Tax=Heterodermia speciosa TaxID=116794 RepID=A0A8H3INQ0_9LECA|nr:MAG: hypothetical protein HETSPECPRED_004660 [Heterodermia speciosa]
MTSPTSPTTPRLAAGPWQPEDDEKLIQARKQSLNWSDISQQYFPAKTANACRKRHERLMDKRHTNEEWQPYKLEQMAVAYLDCREEMWKILAQAVGENWKDVESKCFEKGVKNLTNLGRSASRRGGRPSLPTVNEDDPHDDSGYADEQHHSDPYSASSVAPSSRRTVSNASSIAPTPLLQLAPPPGAPVQQPPYQPIQPQQFPFQHQHQQSIPSIASLLESTRAPNPNAMVTTSY